MINLKINWIWILVSAVAIILLVKSCEPEVKTVTKTKTITKIVTDTIKETVIKEVPKTVYVEKIKTVKGKDSIVYVNAQNDNTIEAKQYDTELKANNATAKLKITTTGELLDVFGTITYPEKETTIETVKTVPMSGLFIYGGASVVPMLQSAEVGIDYQIKNSVIIGVNASHNFEYDFNSVGVKLGVRIF